MKAPLQAALGAEHVLKGEPLMQLWLGAVPAKILAATADKATLPGTQSPQWAPDAEPTIKTGVITLTSAALELMKK